MSAETMRYTGENHAEIIRWIGEGPFFGRGAGVDRAGDLLIAVGSPSGAPMRARAGEYIVKTPGGFLVRKEDQ